MSKCNMRHLLCTLLLMAFATYGKAQSVGINTPNPHGSAALDISSTTKGILVPRLTTAQRTAIDTPAIGLLVFDTDLQQFIFNVDTGWVTIQAGTTGTSSWAVSGNNQYAALGGSVGIGNNNPNALLTLGGALAFSGIDPVFTVNVSNNETVLLGNEDNLHGILLGVGGNGIQGRTGAGFATSHHLLLNPNGGYVGIGNNNPATALDITGKTKTDSLQITAGAAAGHVLQSDSAGNATWVSYSIFPDRNWIANGQDQYAAFGGNVGVGNTNPTAKFHVTGKTKTDSLQITAGAVAGHILQTDANGNASWVDPVVVSGSTWTASGNNLYAALSGNVGIGNNSPLYKLSVGDQLPIGGVNPIAVFNAAGNKAVVVADSALAKGIMLGYDGNDIQGRGGNNLSNNSHLILNQYGGNVGVGTNAPTEKLDVLGKTKTVNLQMTNGATAGHILQSDATGNATWVNANTLAVSYNETDPKIAAANNDAVQRWNGTKLVDGVIKDDSTNVGIGTAPLATNRLTIAGKTQTDSLRTIRLQITNGANNGYVLQSDAAGNAAWVNSTALPNGNWTTAGSNQFSAVIGNVGIGTNSPSAKLDVAGTAKVTNFQMPTGATTGYVMRSDAVGNASWVNTNTLTVNETDPQVASTTGGRVPKWSGTSLVDGIMQDDGLGIGINTAPTTATALTVNGKTSTSSLQITTGAVSGYVLRSNGATGNAVWADPATLPSSYVETDPKVGTLTNNLIPRWNGTSLTNTQVFDNGTATGIATTAPLSVLDVNGAMGLKVKGTLTSSSSNPDNTAGIWIYTTNSGPITLPAANTCANRMYVIANRTITPILMNPATSYIGLNGILATNIAASSAIWIVSDGSAWQQIR